MTLRQLRYEGDISLKKTCKEVLTVDDKIRELLDDMMDTLRANQVGILKRLVVVDYGDCQYKLVNPKIIGQSGVQECIEGCLSFPNRFGMTIRPQSVTIQALNENGEEIILTGEWEMAKCFCHEIEHLDGACFLDKVIKFIS